MEASSIIKNEAKERLRGNWRWAILVCLILAVLPLIANIVISIITTTVVFSGSIFNFFKDYINGLVTTKAFMNGIGLYLAVNLISWAASIAVMTLTISKTAFFMKIAENKSNGIKDFFKEKRYFESFKTDLLVAVKTFLWSLLFIIPGIIKSFSYAMTPYLKYKNPSRGVNECIKESCRMMQGYKGSLFILYLSFIGWWLLAGLASAFVSWLPGIGYVLSDIISFVASAVIGAYVGTSVAIFYKELTFPYLNAKMRSEAAGGAKPFQNSFGGGNNQAGEDANGEGSQTRADNGGAEKTEKSGQNPSGGVFECFDNDRNESGGNTQSDGNDAYKRNGD